MSGIPPEMSFKAFAVLNGWARSYVTQLRKDGRLVLTADGKAVRVAESLARIAATADPSRAAVAARHAQARSAPTPEGAGTPAPAPAAESGEGDPEGKGPGTDSYQAARARKEHWLALGAERDYLLGAGRLVEVDAVVAAAAAIATQLRQRLEGLGSRMADRVAALGGDVHRIRAALDEDVAAELEQAVRQLGALGRSEAAP